MSTKILAQAREQQDAIDAEDDLDQWDDESATPAKGVRRGDSDDDDDDIAHGEEDKFDGDQQHFFRELVWPRIHTDTSHTLQDIAAEDERTLELFMPKEVPKRLTLADIILGKIKDKETEIASQIDIEGVSRPSSHTSSLTVMQRRRRSSRAL